MPDGAVTDNPSSDKDVVEVVTDKTTVNKFDKVVKSGIKISGDRDSFKRVFKDTDGGVSSAVSLVDEMGLQAAIFDNPAYVTVSSLSLNELITNSNAMLKELKKITLHLSIMTDTFINTCDVES